MAASVLPHVTAYGNIAKVLEKIKSAETPPRFTQDFLATTLDMPGGTAKPVIPFLRRTGFLGSDGVPTDLYKRFRNEAQRPAAAAEALRIGYKPLYAINEFIHDANDPDLRGVVLQATGQSEDSTSLGPTLGSFKAMRAYADFNAPAPEVNTASGSEGGSGGGGGAGLGGFGAGVNLGYTINLHLPATSDVAVFDAIFKSLKEHLLQ